MFLPPHRKKTEWFGVEVSMFLPTLLLKKKKKKRKLPLSLLLSSFSSLTADLLKRYSFFISIYYHVFYAALYRRRFGQDVPHMPLKHVRKKMRSTIKLMQRRTRAKQANAAGA